MRYLALCLLIMGLFNSCGPSGEQSSPADLHSNTQALQPQVIDPSLGDNFQKIVAQFSFHCKNELNCNPSSVLVLTQKTFQTKVINSRCSGFLISSDIVMTNEHCLDGISQNNIATKFAIITLNGEKVFGKKILYRTHPSKTLLDLAVIRLEKSLLSPILKVSKKGINQNEELIAWSTEQDPNDSTKFHLLPKNHCRSTSKSLAWQYYRNNFSPKISLKNCDSRAGNSGSAITNENGEVVAVLDSISKKDFAENFKKRFKNIATFPNTLKTLTIASNLVCAPFDFTTFEPKALDSQIKSLCQSQDIGGDHLALSTYITSTFYQPWLETSSYYPATKSVLVNYMINPEDENNFSQINIFKYSNHQCASQKTDMELCEGQYIVNEYYELEDINIMNCQTPDTFLKKVESNTWQANWVNKLLMLEINSCQ